MRRIYQVLEEMPQLFSTLLVFGDRRTILIGQRGEYFHTYFLTLHYSLLLPLHIVYLTRYTASV